MITKKHVDSIAYKVVGCAIEVHRELGPGLLESVYHTCLTDEIRSLGFHAATEVLVPVIYKGKSLGKTLKIDLLVEDLVIIELKAVEQMIPLYKAQLLSYLKLTQKPKGLLINFHCRNITEQLVPLVTPCYAELPG